jgi:two-component system sensor histidine kinase/response regulator
MNKFKPTLFSILMVDDNPKNLQLLGNTLRNEGYQLEFATNGPTALAWLDKKDFDLVLLDIMMPDMSGFEVCEKLRVNPKNSDLPVIFLTAKTEKESIIEGFKLGAQDYITKPFDTAELLARVHTQLELRFRKEQLKDLNQSLEEKVKERTQQLQEANDKLQNANEELLLLDKAKSDFLHIISHEIRTPLNGIKGSLELIKENITGGSIDVLYEILDASVTRLERFSIAALKVTQLKTGKYELDIQSFSLSNFIDSTLKKLSQKIKEKSLLLVKDFQSGTDIIFSDYELLSTCMEAIIANSIKYSPVNGKITIKIISNGNGKIIEVADEGPGFSALAMKNLFKLFSPGEKHINENEGIELALTKLIMDAHNGTISVENHPKGGALVKLTFPENVISSS